MSFPSGVTRFPNGVSSNAEGSFAEALPFTSPSKYLVQSEDFTHWYESSVDATTSNAIKYDVTSLAGADLVAAGADTNGWAEIQMPDDITQLIFYGFNQPFEFVAGVPFWFEARFQQNANITNNQMIFGVTNTPQFPTLPDDGFYFSRLPGAAGNMDFECSHNGDVEITDTVGQVELGVPQKIAFYFDGETVEWYYQGNLAGRAVVGDLPLGPVSILIGSLSIQDVTNMGIDYFWIATEVSR